MRQSFLSLWTHLSTAAAVAVFAGIVASPADAYEVESSSLGNLLHLQLDDRTGAASSGTITVTPTEAPPWITIGDITVDRSRVVDIAIPFDVGDVAAGEKGRLDLEVVGTNAYGDELFRATHTVPLQARLEVDDTQYAFGITECCMEIIDVGEAETVPSIHRLVGNTPNPFRSLTNIVFGLPVEGGVVEVNVFDIQGRLVRTIATPRLSGGFHRVTWDGRDEAGRLVSPGAYFYRVTSGTWVETRKLHLLP